MIRGYSEFHPETLRYMSTSDPKHRKALGQFFTPKSIREELLGKLPKLFKPKVLDPACGSGEFLLSARDYFIEPELYCWEIDCKLADIARKVVGNAVVECVDSLRKPFKEEFDVIIGNPPYFEFKPDREIREKFKEIISGRVNIYAFFVYLGLRMLKPGGYLAYVVSSSMNNGAYFRKLREYIVRNAEIEYLKVLDRSDKLFEEAKHMFQLLVLRKTRNTGKYVFKHGNIMIFSEKADLLSKIFSDPNTRTLRELGYKVETGKVVWNQNRDKLTTKQSEGVVLVWAHNIKGGKLVLANKPGKPQYIKWDKTDRGPAIAVTRIVGHPKRAQIEACLIPPGLRFVAENHVNIIYPPLNASIEEMEEIVRQLNSKEVQEVVRIITGNTQISKTELENLIPIKLEKFKARLTLFHRKY